MRRFFRARRKEDHSQIQYLTAKCTRMAHDKALLDRDFLVSRDRERTLQNDLGAVVARLRLQEQLNAELRAQQGRLVGRIHQQQEMVDSLQQRVVLLVEESSRDAELLWQVNSELLCLQSSEVRLEGLVEELHVEARRGAVVAEGLHAELRCKTAELEKLQDTNEMLAEELKDLRVTHQKEVRELQQENEGSLKKLQETAEQFEWLCQQQRYWMRCVKRFKDCLVEQRDALLRQVSALRKKDEKTEFYRDASAQSVLRPLQDTKCCDSALSRDAEAGLESQVKKSCALYDKTSSAPSTETRNLLEDRSLEPGLFFSSRLLPIRR